MNASPANSSAFSRAPSRYVVGLDLGTTNSVLAYIDTAEVTDKADAVPSIHEFAVAQLIKAGEMGAEPLLPSFLYLPGPGEIDPAQLTLPWAKERSFAVGRFAREHGSLVPTRLVSSAKSWLCHGGVDRRAALLPWTAEPDFPKLSPLEATVRLLEHLRDAWNHQLGAKNPQDRLENQDIVLTVPASFDAVARELTVEAARKAGLERITLFEEPQAAFYAWLHQRGDHWRQEVKAGDVALVIDVGGGTTDLTLIGVSQHDGDLTLERLAVGEHLLLGGDNMDLTLAHHLAQQLREKSTKIDAVQMLALWHASRVAKETLFENNKLKSQTVSILGRGRKVVGGTIRTELTRELLEQTLVEGFFPCVEQAAEPVQQQSVGLQELGLAYAADPAITKQLAAFLRRHAEQTRQFDEANAQAGLPSAVLFNGGVFRAEALRQRVLEQLNSWAKGKTSVRELPTASLDRAVALGSAYYGLVRRGKGIRIRGGVARSYYIGVAAAMPAVPGFAPPIRALCVVPQGTEEGTEAELPNREFGLVVGAPVQFRFLSSTQRPEDKVGHFVDDWEETIEELSPIQTTLDAPAPSGQTIPVRLHSKVTAIGTLELWCQGRDTQQRWKLEYNVREPQ